MDKAIATLLILFLFTATGAAQVGIRGNYHVNNASGWKVNTGNEENNTSLLANGFSVGVDYWLRLKNVRVEFLPELNYGQYRQSQKGPFVNVDAAARSYSLFLNTNLYFLDFMGDCDCPTWSKQGGLLKKGLFLQLSPGVSLFDLGVDFRKPDSDSSTPNLISREETGEWLVSLGAALGFDIGLSDLVTLTPLAGLRYFAPRARWEGLEKYAPENCLCLFTVERPEARLLQYTAGLRLGLRFDH